MIAKIEKASRPKYFNRNNVCARIEKIAYVQKLGGIPYGFEEKGYTCSIFIGMLGVQNPQIAIPCKDEIEQAAIYSELTTILTAL